MQSCRSEGGGRQHRPSGYLKLALVSCPIALHAVCSTAERIAFRQINKATGNRLRQQPIDEETREPVAPEHKGRGYEVAKGQYLVVEDDELEAIEIESTHVIEIITACPRRPSPPLLQNLIFGTHRGVRLRVVPRRGLAGRLGRHICLLALCLLEC